MPEITIFTPTYNRAYILPVLYKSLEEQTCKDFIWLIVDDGSTDDTYSLVQKWIKEGKIKIDYYKQNNQGKSMAHNRGVECTKTTLFTCVDSDDFLIKDAIESILYEWNRNSSLSLSKTELVGILAFKGYADGSILTSMRNLTRSFSTLKNAYSKLGLLGDTMLIFKTDIIAQFKFPSIENEKFVPEAYLYDLIDQKGELLIYRKILYLCNYLEDGYTNSMAKILTSNPNGYLVYINQRLKLDNNLKDKILNTIRYTSMCIHMKKKNIILNSVYPFITCMTFPLALIFFIKRYWVK